MTSESLYAKAVKDASEEVGHVLGEHDGILTIEEVEGVGRRANGTSRKSQETRQHARINHVLDDQYIWMQHVKCSHHVHTYSMLLVCNNDTFTPIINFPNESVRHGS